MAAISGIDTNIKVGRLSSIWHSCPKVDLQLFSPTSSRSSFSRMNNAEQIVETNKRTGSARIVRANVAALQVLADMRNALENEESRPSLECTHQ